MSSDKGADDVLYIEHGDFTVCTCGARQSLIEVKSQMYVKRENGHLIATEKDRMHPCHICLKATTAATAGRNCFWFNVSWLNFCRCSCRSHSRCCRRWL